MGVNWGGSAIGVNVGMLRVRMFVVRTHGKSIVWGWEGVAVPYPCACVCVSVHSVCMLVCVYTHGVSSMCSRVCVCARVRGVPQCVCVCVCARARVCGHTCMRMCVYESMYPCISLHV